MKLKIYYGARESMEVELPNDTTAINIDGETIIYRDTIGKKEDTPVDFMEQAYNIVDASSIDFTCTKDDVVRYVNDVLKNAREMGEEVPYSITKWFL